jgi:hypothetical protein
VYRADKALLDFDVKDAMDALVRHYHAGGSSAGRGNETRRPCAMGIFVRPGYLRVAPGKSLAP